MKSKLFTASLVASALFAGLGVAPAMAQSTNTPRIDQAQQAISTRIQQGMASGHITPSEAQVLIRRERDIQMRENQYKANGSANPQERQQLRADLSALNADVERMMANREVVRPGYAGNAGDAASTPGIDNREYQIGQRIDEGVRSGRITQREARRLERREREIARHEAFFKSDGVVTRNERRQLRDELDALREDVERMMHNNDRYGRG
ncbi:hypothetical protein [Polaromonas naphthalenivorans]|uniref:Uncharacterized protein n=1 Tax=Polaromonas naphthalenivorans (strain CJ2) TaxID=365044 RepID=A1VLW8_POLNA|nr:hypothetical protein [Polaromonas naphthalenivorans]ABM36646.1 conserved hypothetical protein [Polaromonas naphthalenivorans CJ2]